MLYKVEKLGGNIRYEMEINDFIYFIHLSHLHHERLF